MPVRILSTTSSSPRNLTLEANDAVPTQLQLSDSTDIVVPWLSAAQTLTDPQFTLDGKQFPIQSPLHALAEDEKLIGFAGADADVFKPIFEGVRIVGVPLDLARPLAGSMAAWGSLDGIALDASAAARLTELQLGDLLASGTAVAVRSPTKPAGNWPWRRSGEYWLLQIKIAGPSGAYNPQAYSPTAAFLRGWPAIRRREVLLMSLVFAIFALALILWQSKWSIPILVLLTAATVFGVIHSRALQPVLLQANGAIVVRDVDFSQYDEWHYRAVLRPSHQIQPWQPTTWPILGYRQQLTDTNLTLHCDSLGIPQQFEYELLPQQALAFLHRSVLEGGPNTIFEDGITSPLKVLADELYLAPSQDTLKQGMGPGDETHWPPLLIQRQNR